MSRFVRPIPEFRFNVRCCYAEKWCESEGKYVPATQKEVWDHFVEEGSAKYERILKLEAQVRRLERERELANRCEHCGAQVSSYPKGCPTCGAPNCCQMCCKVEHLTRELEQAQAAVAALHTVDTVWGGDDADEVWPDLDSAIADKLDFINPGEEFTLRPVHELPTRRYRVVSEFDEDGDVVEYKAEWTNRDECEANPGQPILDELTALRGWKEEALPLIEEYTGLINGGPLTPYGKLGETVLQTINRIIDKLAAAEKRAGFPGQILGPNPITSEQASGIPKPTPGTLPLSVTDPKQEPQSCHLSKP